MNRILILSIIVTQLTFLGGARADLGSSHGTDLDLLEYAPRLSAENVLITKEFLFEQCKDYGGVSDVDWLKEEECDKVDSIYQLNCIGSQVIIGDVFQRTASIQEVKACLSVTTYEQENCVRSFNKGLGTSASVFDIYKCARNK